MAMTVDSSQWTGQRDETPLTVPIVWGEFASEAARDAAERHLREAGAQESSSVAGATGGGIAEPRVAANEGQVEPPDEHPRQADRRNQRQLGVGIAMAATSMGAAGLVIATGGAALPAVAAAAAAGAATAAVGEPVVDAMSPQSEQATQRPEPATPPPAEGPVLGLQAPDEATRARAEALLREAGARRVFVQETRAG